jgi:hypothetical protein
VLVKVHWNFCEKKTGSGSFSVSIRQTKVIWSYRNILVTEINIFPLKITHYQRKKLLTRVPGSPFLLYYFPKHFDQNYHLQ